MKIQTFFQPFFASVLIALAGSCATTSRSGPAALAGIGQIQEQDRRIQQQETTIAQLKKEMETVLVRLKEHDSEIQRVGDQVKINSVAAQFVSSDH
jgi:septal ring factor EnvC (AmiA/AmiB activator)